MNIRCHLPRVRAVLAAGIALVLCLFFVIQPALISASARKPFRATEKTEQETPNDRVRKVAPLPPERGAPALNLPNLDEVRQRRQSEPVTPAPIESTVRARRKSTAATEPRRSHHGISRNAARANSANTIVAEPPPLQSGQPPFTDDPLKNPNNPESFKVKAIHITELRTAINAVRNRRHLADYSWQKPAASSGVINTNVLISWEPIGEMRTALDQAIGPPPNGYAAELSSGFPIRATHIQELRERVKGILGSSSITDQLVPARIDPFNQSGNQIQARDAEWSLPLVSLPGRAGLDLGIGLTYSSMVWTQAGSNISFDDDGGDPSPGFRLGFPTIQGRFTNNLVGGNVYLLITAAGRRTELRRVGTTNTYEAGDSSYLQLIDYGSSLLLRTTDGTQMSYGKFGSDWHCTQIEDRNGNLILANYNSFGDLTNVTDTLGRVFTFNYDGNGNLLSITQPWTVNGSSQTHTWATFGWSTKTIQTAFSSSLALVGTYNGETIPVLTQVGLADGSHYNFEYNSNGQVNLIRHYAEYGGPGTSDDFQLSYFAYDYESPTADCPRISAARVWASNWSGVGNVPNEVPTYFADNHDGSHQMTTPDGSVYKESYGGPGDSPAWKHGLVTSAQVVSGGTVQKTTTVAYTQDNTGVDYQTNPRVIETNVTDGTNNRRTTVDYSVPAYAQYGLPYFVSEYEADGTTEIRRTYTDYNLSQAFVDRRIIGLVSERKVKDMEANQWVARMTYGYDSFSLNSQATTAVGHDQSYDVTATVRGNLTAVSRWDVNNINTVSTTSSMHYDAAGSLLSTSDPLGHTTSITYTDKFSAGGATLDAARSFSTFAYPTTVTDADGFSTSVWYNYDLSAKTRAQGPPPQNQSQGIIQTFTYDTARRLKQVTTVNTGAYVHYDYGPDFVSSFGSVNSMAANYGESDTFTHRFFDGLGRMFAVASNHPGSTGGNKGQYTRYDQMGRAVQQTNPFEMNSVWQPAGDDNAGAQSNVANTFDWKGRPLRTYNMDGTYQEASYAGCGCAGGEVVTLTDEVGRQQKVYADVLGRQWKTEVLNWDGSVYSATVNSFNARDQVTLARQWSGAENGGGAYQDTTMSYDGYGRLESQRSPEQNTGTATVYAYNTDDTLQSVTDARGASASYIYNNNRHLVNEIHYSAPSGITPTPNATFSYDAAGNRTSMTDGLGSVSYGYDSLSRISSEVRTFNSVGSFTLSYDYNLAGDLNKITDASGMTINYGYDAKSRLSSVTGSDNLYASVANYASSFQYRAFDGLKSMLTGSNRTISVLYNVKLQPSQFDISGSVVDQTYDYYNDGKLSFVHNQPDFNFDRSLFYDHIGRLVEAKTGGSARGGTGDVPYHETFGFDQFSNLTERTAEDWNATNSLSDSSLYTTNRRSGWGYDADGRNTSIGTRNYSFDADGQTKSMSGQKWIINHYVPTNQTIDYDGDGDRAKETFDGVTTYYLKSTAFDGEIVEEINSSGQKTVGYVRYPEGEILAKQVSGNVIWQQMTPAGTSRYETYVNNSNYARTELDPMGANIPTDSPPVPDTNGQEGDIGGNHVGGIMDSRWSNFFDLSGGCSSLTVTAACHAPMSPDQYLDAQLRSWLGDKYYDLPGNNNERERAENAYSEIVKKAFASNSSTQPKKKPKLKPQKTPPRHLTPEERRKAEEKRAQDGKKNGNNEDVGGGIASSSADRLPNSDQTACMVMADVAQNVANLAASTSNPLEAFDNEFSRLYHGGPIRTLGDAQRYRPGDLRQIDRYFASNGSGFQERFRDTGTEAYPLGGRMAEQTHHFSAYMSLGVNGLWLIYQAGMLNDNDGDKRLSRAAYTYGQLLRRDPGQLAGVGAWIRTNICNGEGRGLY